MKKIKGGYDSFPNQPMGYPSPSYYERFQNYGHQGFQKVNDNRVASGIIFLIFVGCIIGLIYYLTREKTSYDCNVNTYQCEKFEKKEDSDKEKGNYEDEESCKEKCINNDITVKFKCNTITYTCEEDDNGEYDSKTSCENSCVAPPPPAECNSNDNFCKYISDPFQNNCLIDYVRSDDNLFNINKTDTECKQENKNKLYTKENLGTDIQYCKLVDSSVSTDTTSLYDCLNLLDTGNLKYYIDCKNTTSCVKDLKIQLCSISDDNKYYYYNNMTINPTNESSLIKLIECDVADKYNNKEYNSMKDLLEDINNNDNIVENLYHCDNSICSELTLTKYLQTEDNNIYDTNTCNDQCEQSPITLG